MNKKNNYVYVISKNGKPLMPTRRYRRVRLLLKTGEAKVVKRKPFTIKLQYETKEYVQKLKLGIDPGSEKIAVSVRKNSGEIVFAGELETRKKDVSKNMLERKMYRRNRRQHRRKKRQRRAVKNGTVFTEKYYKISGREEPLCCKLIKSKKIRYFYHKRKKGWLTPTAKHLLETHKNIIKIVKKLMPIDKVYLEYNKFDIHKLEKPDVSGKKYQEGQKKGFLNSHEYVLCRDKHKCKLCEKEKTVLQVHHIQEVCNGGTNKPENLITLCEKCHKKVHKNSKTAKKVKEIFKDIQKRYVHATVLNTIIPYFYDWLKKEFSEVSLSYGYETKEKRYKLNLNKEHYIDAYMISLEENMVDKMSIVYLGKVMVYKFNQFRRHHRQIIHAIRDRNYKLDGKIVAKNRNKRIGQLTDSLAEFVKARGKEILAKLKVLPGKKVIRSNFSKFAKGDTVKYEGKVYIVKGYGEMGRRLGFVGQKQYVPTKHCKLVTRNTGIVCL